MWTGDQTQPIPVADATTHIPADWAAAPEKQGPSKGMLALGAVLLALGGAVAGGLAVDAITYTESDLELARNEAASESYETGYQEGYDKAGADSEGTLREAFEMGSDQGYDLGYEQGYEAGLEEGSQGNGKDDPQGDDKFDKDEGGN